MVCGRLLLADGVEGEASVEEGPGVKRGSRRPGEGRAKSDDHLERGQGSEGRRKNGLGLREASAKK